MIPRIFTEQNLAANTDMELPPEQVHYLQHVLRRKEGSEVIVFNGHEGEFFANFSFSSKKKAHLKVGAVKRAQEEEGDLWLCHAPLQRHALEYLIEKGTELGVSRFLPVTTRHSNPHRINTPRLSAIAREAAEQTERLTLPSFADMISLEILLENWPQERRLILCAEAGDTIPLADYLSQDISGPFAIMTGPEGGYAQTELDLIPKFSFVTPVGLGPRILRAETAALAALAIFQAIKGDGRKKAPRPTAEIE